MTTTCRKIKLADVRTNLKNGWSTLCTVIYVDFTVSLSLNGKDQFCIRIADDTAQTSFVYYGAQAKKAYGMLRVGMVIDLVNPLVIPNNAKYSVSHHKYFLQDNIRSGKWKVSPDYEIPYVMPTLAYKFTPIDALPNCTDVAVDVVVCVRSSAEFVAAGDSGYRLLVVFDGTSVVDLKIWGPMGSQFPYTESGIILAFKDLRTTMWENVVSLSTTKFSTVVLSPEVVEADRLREVVNSKEFAQEKLVSVSSTQNKFKNSPVVTIDEGIDRAKKSDKSVFIVIEGSIDSVSPTAENVIYPACPHCKCKMDANGKCKKESCMDKVTAVSYGKRLKLDVSHKGMDCVITCWADSVDEVFGVTGFELVTVFHDDSVKFNSMYDGLVGQTKMFAIQARSVYNEGSLDVVFNLMGCMNKYDYDREFSSLAGYKTASTTENKANTKKPVVEESEINSSQAMPAIDLPSPSTLNSCNDLFGDSTLSPSRLNLTTTLGDGAPESDDGSGSDDNLFSHNFPLPAGTSSDITPATRKSTRIKSSSNIPPKVRKTLHMP